MILTESKVRLVEESHRYFDKEGREYFGITGMIGRQLFPDKYSDVPDAILKRAAERGSNIHSLCELYDTVGLESEESREYADLCEANGLRHEASEYIVNDDYFATPIDKVYRVSENHFILADIKTTYKFDEEYVSWQLSIGSHLFELCNPGAVIDGLFGIHLRDGAKLYKVERKAEKDVIALMEAERNGEQYGNPVKTEEDMPQKYVDLFGKIKYIEEQCKYWADQSKQLKAGLLDEMKKADVLKWQCDDFSFTRRKDTTREDFDKKQFKKDHPELYAQYIKQSNVTGSVTIKIN